MQNSSRFQNVLVKRYGLQLYNDLHDAGANDEHICKLGLLLEIADHWNRTLDQRHEKDKATKKKMLRGMRRERLAASISALNPSFPPQGITSENERAARDLWATREKTFHENIERNLKSQRGIGLILSEYCPPPWKSGAVWTLIESFFFLAVTEHLRKKNTKRKPYYPLAVKLLKVIRGETCTCSHVETQRAISRVRQLKISHRGYESHLKILERFPPAS